MSEKPPGQIITFYSYKGGVGRSMALANVATLLAQQQKDVLVIDFDLEAPGLPEYFLSRSRPPAPSGKESSAGKGTIEFFSDLYAHLRQRYPDPGAIEEDQFPEARTVAARIIREMLDSHAYYEEVHLRDPNDPAAAPRLLLMPAGRFDESYPERVRTFDWRGFAEAFPFVFAAVVQELGRHDYVLIDSRTGITDAGGVCTALLPDKLALVFSLNEQSLRGAVQIGRQAVRHRADIDAGRLMCIFPLPSRVENAEEGETKYWIRDARRRFEGLFEELYGEKANLEVYFEQVRIPHKAYYSFGEKIAAEISRETESQSLTEAYARFLQQLGQDQARAERSGPHRVPTTERDGLLLISLGGDSLWPEVNAARAELGLSSIPNANVLDFQSPRFVEPEVERWTLLAEELRDRIRPWINDPRYQRFHLFYRGPVVMAPLLGALIVPNRPLHIYYYDNGAYRLAYICDKRLVRSQ